MHVALLIDGDNERRSEATLTGTKRKKDGALSSPDKTYSGVVVVVVVVTSDVNAVSGIR